jgi:hypothetical protein
MFSEFHSIWKNTQPREHDDAHTRTVLSFALAVSGSFAGVEHVPGLYPGDHGVGELGEV